MEQVAQAEKIQVQSITIIPGEGPIDGSNDEVTVDSWFAADSLLFKIAKGSPSGRSCLKTDFRITFEDGSTYKGRYEVRNLRVEFPELRAHVQDFVRYSSGIDCPEHMTESDWREYLNATEKYAPGAVAQYRELYENYEIM